MGLAAKVKPVADFEQESVNAVDRAKKRDALRKAMRDTDTKLEALAVGLRQDAGYLCRQFDRMVAILDSLPDEVEEKFHELCLAMTNKVVVDRNDVARLQGEMLRVTGEAMSRLHGRLDLLPHAGPMLKAELK